MTDTLNASDYLVQFTFSSAAGLSLGDSLLAFPADQLGKGSTLLASRGRLQTATNNLRAGVAVGDVGASAQHADHALDVALGALRSRLDACAMLPVAQFPKAARAAELIAQLFPQGMAFLNFHYDEEWAITTTILELVLRQGLDKDIDALAGPEFLLHVRYCHDVVGKALQAVADAKSSPKPNLYELIRTLSQAINDWALQVLATQDPSQPATIDAARRALQPILDERAEQAQARKPKAKKAAPQSSTPADPTKPTK
jgi:hypothetical protein